MGKFFVGILAGLIATIALAAPSGYSPFGYITWKSPVSNSSALPTSGNTLGDARIDQTLFQMWVWDGSAWISTTAPTGSSISGSLPNSGQIPYVSAPQTLSESGNLLWNNSSQTLTVNNLITLTGSNPTLNISNTNGGGHDWQFLGGFTAQSSLDFFDDTAGLDRLYLDQNGNLTLVAPTGQITGFSYLASGGNPQYELNNTNSGGEQWLIYGGFQSQHTLDFYDQSVGKDRLFIDQNGNVEIIAPTGNLNVQSLSTSLGLCSDSSKNIISCTSSQNLNIGTITASGNVAASGQTFTGLEFNATGANPFMNVNNTNGGGHDWQFYGGFTAQSTLDFFDNTAGKDRMYLDSNGNLTLVAPTGIFSADQSTIAATGTFTAGPVEIGTNAPLSSTASGLGEILSVQNQWNADQSATSYAVVGLAAPSGNYAMAHAIRGVLARCTRTIGTAQTDTQTCYGLQTAVSYTAPSGVTLTNSHADSFADINIAGLGQNTAGSTFSGSWSGLVVSSQTTAASGGRETGIHFGSISGGTAGNALIADNVTYASGGEWGVNFAGDTKNSFNGSMNIGGAITAPNLSTSSAAQTGTVCWTTGTGNFTVDTTTTCLLSTRKVKKYITPLSEEDGLATVLKMQPVHYELKNDPTHIGEQVGFISEEVDKIDHRLVSRDKNGDPLGVRYQQYTAILTKSIQELHQMIIDQKKELESLKSSCAKK